ncbi:MAG: alpha/beta hydrolase [Vicinamibacteria bacterium]|jgi:hypothetical protein|nr:alpha/beta hydrolase [Vicinamibacteria bacterium]
MPQTENFDLAGPVGRLEAVLMTPDAPPVAAAVFCHAHPLFGGVMHFKPVFRAARALQEHDVAALRFNFRGVGRSEGVHAHGVGEQDDARAALDEMARRFPGLPLLIGGFSFGSIVALRVAAREARVRAVIACAVPLRREYVGDAFPAVARPRLFVQGGADEFGNGDAIRAQVAQLPPPHELVVVEGASHFFDGRLDEYQAAIANWAARRPWLT